jgi:hypothetical protein
MTTIEMSGYLRLGAMALVCGLAAPVTAQDMAREDCATIWSKAQAALQGVPHTFGTVGMDQGWCLVDRLVLKSQSEYGADWETDQVRFRASAGAGLFYNSVLPESFELDVRGLRIVPHMGSAQMKYLFGLQTFLNKIDASLAYSWERDARVLNVTKLAIDFPAENEFKATARIINVDLSSEGTLQGSAAGFGVTNADVELTTNGFFESYMAMALGPILLPQEGDMEAEVRKLRAKTTAAIGDLPGTTFSSQTKSALKDLVADLPQPKGTLTLSLRADQGFGPVRLTRYAMTGLPETVADLAPIFDGVQIDADWPEPKAKP